MKNFDCVVVGGGMIGAASALSLANLGLKVAIVEAYQPKAFDDKQPFDLRVSAISVATQQLLEQLNCWDFLSKQRICPYSKLGVWETELSYTEFDASDIEESLLGHIVENRLIQLSLWQQLSLHNNITVYCPNTIVDFTQYDNEIVIELDEKITLHSKLLLAADGANSKVKELACIGSTGWDYAQSAMLINVETELNQQDVTWQKFYETGPVAMLPLKGESSSGGYASLVWYHQKDEIKRLASLSNSQLAFEISNTFPKKLGKIKVLNKGAFPLTRRHANTYQNNRVLLLGDAAHTINPMAGQGVNIGFKDVKALQHVISSAIGSNECWHSPSILSRYEKARRKDNLIMMSTMDALYGVFSHPSIFAKIIRNTGLFIAQNTPLLKNKALAYACGIK